MTDLQTLLAKWRKIAEQKTKGPWYVHQDARYPDMYSVLDESSLNRSFYRSNAEFIALSSRILDALLDVAEAGKEARKRMSHSSFCAFGRDPGDRCSCSVGDFDEALARLAEVGRQDA